MRWPAVLSTHSPSLVRVHCPHARRTVAPVLQKPGPRPSDIVFGDAQYGIVGWELPQPLVVKLLDANGQAVQGQVVNFRVTEGGGSVFAQSLTVTASSSLTFTFTATATTPPGTLSALVAVSNTNFSATVGTTQSLAAKAVDGSGTPISGVTITWTALTTGNSITPSSMTDNTGIARATVTLSKVTAPNQFQAGVSGSSVTPVTFTITTTPGRACRLVFSNFGQTADRGDPVPLNLQVAVYDSLNNPVPNFPVSVFFDLVGPYDVRGTVSPLQTDGTGLASTGGTIILGSPIGDQSLTQNTVRPCGWNNAPFAGMGVGVMHALATPVTGLVNITQQQSGPAGSTILLRVRAVDRHNFYVPGASISASVTAGDGTFSGGGTTASTSTAPANSQNAEPGTATLSYTVGSAATQQITLTSNGVSVVITVTRNP